MLPKGWSEHHFGDVVDIASGQVDPKEPPYSSMRHVGPEDIESDTGRIVGGERTCAELGLISGKYEFDEKAVVYSKIRPHLNKVCRPGFSGVCSADAYPIWPHEIHLSGDYLAQYMLSPIFVKMAVACSMRTGMPKINRNDLQRIDIRLPPPSEQLDIVRTLSVWDEAVATSEAVLVNLRRQKDALLRTLLKRRRGADPAHASWNYVDLEQVFERVRRKNASGNSNVLTISGEHGLISQRDYFKKHVASDNLAGYTLLLQGEFAYNKSYSAGYPMGAIKPLTSYESGVVSSLYICFRFRDGVEADPDFFRHYFEAGLLNDELTGIAQEGARNHGLLNVGVGDFFKLRLHIPAVEEQRRIALVLNAAESEESSISEQIRLLREEKSALMQQLLTGKRRVRSREPAEAASQ